MLYNTKNSTQRYRKQVADLVSRARVGAVHDFYTRTSDRSGRLQQLSHRPHVVPVTGANDESLLHAHRDTGSRVGQWALRTLHGVAASRVCGRVTESHTNPVTSAKPRR